MTSSVLRASVLSWINNGWSITNWYFCFHLEARLSYHHLALYRTLYLEWLRDAPNWRFTFL
jgi:hypothetical protein